MPLSEAVFYLFLYYPCPHRNLVSHNTWHWLCISCQFTAQSITHPQIFVMEPSDLARRTSPDRNVAHSASPNPSLQDSTSLDLSEPRRHRHIQGQDVEDQHLRHDGMGDQEHEPPTTEKASTTLPTIFWCPFWLQRRVLGSFFCVFASFAVTLIVLSACSQRNDGLGEARTGFSYLWRFGPTISM